MKKLGLDTLSNDKVIIATGRQDRPMDKEKLQDEQYQKDCPFCRGNEEIVGEQTAVINKDNKWIVKSVKNKYPIVDNDELNKIKGQHDVIIDNYKHNANFFNMTEDEFYYLLLMYKKRFKDLSQDRNTKYICLFKNYLRNAGASLMHSHSQILSLPIIPPDLIKEYEVCDNFYKEKGINMYQSIIEEEIDYQKRVIYNNDDFLVFIPEVCKFAGDTIILFKESLYFYEVEDDKLKSLAIILKKLFGKIYDEHGNCPFNIYLHTHPINEENNYKNSYKVHIHILPRRFNFGGFELSTGMYVSSIESEEIAKTLRFD